MEMGRERPRSPPATFAPRPARGSLTPDRLCPTLSGLNVLMRSPDAVSQQHRPGRRHSRIRMTRIAPTRSCYCVRSGVVTRVLSRRALQFR
jgi:hypothetical protein